MKISQAFRDAYRTAAGQKAETLKFLATETALTGLCLSPMLFLTEISVLSLQMRCLC